MSKTSETGKNRKSRGRLQVSRQGLDALSWQRLFVQGLPVLLVLIYAINVPVTIVRVRRA